MKAWWWNRKIHYWLAIVTALPVFLIVVTGIMLQWRKQVGWIQPPERRGAEGPPQVSFERILAACQSAPDAAIRTWDDIDRLDVRPAKGIVKVRAKNDMEVQIDLVTGEVLQVQMRYSHLIEAVHEGAIFTEPVRYAVFIPTGVILLILWGTGLALFLQPYLRRRKKPETEQQPT